MNVQVIIWPHVQHKFQAECKGAEPAHLGKLVRGATGDLGDAKTGKLGLQVLELQEREFTVSRGRVGNIQPPDGVQSREPSPG